MQGFSYRERGFAFGQLMLIMRTKLALTQTELAEGLGVGCRAVIDNVVAWSLPSGLQASGSLDKMIWLWEVERSSSRLALHGHTAVVHALAFRKGVSPCGHPQSDTLGA